jgi:hypothetical protein
VGQIESAYTSDNDPTHGATYYFSPQSMRPRGRTPGWAKDRTKTLTVDDGEEGRFYRCNNGKPKC